MRLWSARFCSSLLNAPPPPLSPGWCLASEPTWPSRSWWASSCPSPKPTLGEYSESSSMAHKAFRSTHKGQRASLSLGGGCPRRHAIKWRRVPWTRVPGAGGKDGGRSQGRARDSREDRLFLCGWGESRHFSQFSCSVSGSLSHSQLSCLGLGRLLCGVRGGGGQGERGMEA